MAVYMDGGYMKMQLLPLKAVNASTQVIVEQTAQLPVMIP